MNKQKINYAVDFLMLIVLAVNIFSILNRQRDIHEVTGYLFAVLVLIHLLLHWRWIAATTRGFFRREK